MLTERPVLTTRPRFLKQVAATLAVGAGALSLASPAKSYHTAGHCCTDCSRCGSSPWCEGLCHYYCNCSGIGSDYCITSHCSIPNCFNGPC